MVSAESNYQKLKYDGEYFGKHICMSRNGCEFLYNVYGEYVCVCVCVCVRPVEKGDMHFEYIRYVVSNNAIQEWCAYK